MRSPWFGARVTRVARTAAADLDPLRQSPPFRRLFFGITVSKIGTQVTAVAVALQVFTLTRSSLDVGLVGLASLVPLICFGMYGGAIVDAFDRRKLLLVTSSVTMFVSLVLLTQAVVHADRVGLLYGCVAVQAGAAAVDAPARLAIIPQLIRREKLAAANTLDYSGSQLAIISGPLLAGIAASLGGFGWAYGIDVASFAGAFYAATRLPPLWPGPGSRRAGLASVAEGLHYLGAHQVVLATFLVDVNAMLFASPRALFPAFAFERYSGGAAAAGLLYAAPAVGAVGAAAVSGAITRVRRQGLGVVVAIVVWGGAITLFGLARTLWLGLVLLVVAGAANLVSTIYRATILQAVTPQSMQGRLQGVNNIVVTGGPRLGDLRAGAVAAASTPEVSAISGGLACLAGIALLAASLPSFVRYCPPGNGVRPRSAGTTGTERAGVDPGT